MSIRTVVFVSLAFSAVVIILLWSSTSSLSSSQLLTSEQKQTAPPLKKVPPPPAPRPRRRCPRHLRGISLMPLSCQQQQHQQKDEDDNTNDAAVVSTSFVTSLMSSTLNKYPTTAALFSPSANGTSGGTLRYCELAALETRSCLVDETLEECGARTGNLASVLPQKHCGELLKKMSLKNKNHHSNNGNSSYRASSSARLSFSWSSQIQPSPAEACRRRRLRGHMDSLRDELLSLSSFVKPVSFSEHGASTKPTTTSTTLTNNKLEEKNRRRRRRSRRVYVHTYSVPTDWVDADPRTALVPTDQKLFAFSPLDYSLLGWPQFHQPSATASGYLDSLSDGVARSLHERSLFCLVNCRYGFSSSRLVEMMAVGCVPVVVDLAVCRRVGGEYCLPLMPHRLFDRVLALPCLRGVLTARLDPALNHFTTRAKFRTSTNVTIIRNGEIDFSFFDKSEYETLAREFHRFASTRLTYRATALYHIRCALEDDSVTSSSSSSSSSGALRRRLLLPGGGGGDSFRDYKFHLRSQHHNNHDHHQHQQHQPLSLTRILVVPTPNDPVEQIALASGAIELGLHVTLAVTAQTAAWRYSELWSKFSLADLVSGGGGGDADGDGGGGGVVGTAARVIQRVKADLNERRGRGFVHPFHADAASGMLVTCDATSSSSTASAGCESQIRNDSFDWIVSFVVADRTTLDEERRGTLVRPLMDVIAKSKAGRERRVMVIDADDLGFGVDVETMGEFATLSRRERNFEFDSLQSWLRVRRAAKMDERIKGSDPGRRQQSVHVGNLKSDE